MSSDEASHDEQPPRPDDFNMGPKLIRMAGLIGDIMLFTMYSGGIKYDVLFFTPALLAMEESEYMNTGFFEFFAQDFSLEEHAKDFEFSDSETKEEFAKRFFKHIAAAENVPDNIRSLAAKFAKGFKVRSSHPEVKGFFKPCPLYSLVSGVAMVNIIEKEVHGIDSKSLEVFIEFLLKDFDPKVYGIEDEGNVYDIMNILGHGFTGENTPVTLVDGTTCRQHSMNLLERLANHEAVPENVKQVIAVILPCF